MKWLMLKLYLKVSPGVFGYQYAKKKKVRINTVSQSPTRTTAGSGVKGFEGFITFADKMSPLGNATAEDCANYCVTLFSDLTRMVLCKTCFMMEVLVLPV
jgi:enoyl-[acyl-carrier protein] reductase I